MTLKEFIEAKIKYNKEHAVLLPSDRITNILGNLPDENAQDVITYMYENHSGYDDYFGNGDYYLLGDIVHDFYKLDI